MIDPTNDTAFKSADHIYGNVKRDLNSFDAAGLIDEGEFPRYIHDVLQRLGIGVLKEEDAVVRVKDFKACLPKDFKQLYAAYRCTPYVEGKDLAPIETGIRVYNDVTWELLDRSSCSEISVYSAADQQVVDRVTVRQYVDTRDVVVNFKDFVLLRLSPNVNKAKCAENCANLFSDNPQEISIERGQLFTNFSSACVYLKYYACAVDRYGVPLIPDIPSLDKAIEFEIKYQLLFNLWTNNSVPDLQNRWQVFQERAEFFFQEVKYHNKLPSFAQCVNSARRRRAVNPVMVFAR